MKPQLLLKREKLHQLVGGFWEKDLKSIVTEGTFYELILLGPTRGRTYTIVFIFFLISVLVNLFLSSMFFF